MKTIAQQLGITDFPFKIKDKNGNKIYYENSNNLWYKSKFDANNNEIYFEDSDNFWWRKKYDSNNNEIYFENSNNFWSKKEFDANNNEIYYENPYGIIVDNRPKIKELTVSEISQLLGYEIKIVK